MPWSGVPCTHGERLSLNLWLLSWQVLVGTNPLDYLCKVWAPWTQRIFRGYHTYFRGYFRCTAHVFADIGIPLWRTEKIYRKHYVLYPYFCCSKWQSPELRYSGNAIVFWMEQEASSKGSHWRPQVLVISPVPWGLRLNLFIGPGME